MAVIELDLVGKGSYPSSISFRAPAESDLVVETANGPIRVGNEQLPGSVGDRLNKYLEGVKEKNPSALPTPQQLESLMAHLVKGGMAEESITQEELVKQWTNYASLDHEMSDIPGVVASQRKEELTFLGQRDVGEPLDDGRIIKVLRYYKGSHPERGTETNQGWSPSGIETVVEGYEVQDPFPKLRETNQPQPPSTPSLQTKGISYELPSSPNGTVSNREQALPEGQLVEIRSSV